MSPLEIDAAIADLFDQVAKLQAPKDDDAILQQLLADQGAAILRLQTRVAELSDQVALGANPPAVVSVTTPDVTVNVPAQAAPVIQNNIALPEQGDKKFRVSYLDYTGNKKTMEIETVR